MVIVDTSVWIDVFAGRDTAQVTLLRDLSRRQTIGLGDLMLCEVL
ncbi:MAG: PIN domain nuclease [Armatimonadetes bacterium]|nr:PIN domain nuclease [Armatimonadota bacterium]